MLHIACSLQSRRNFGERVLIIFLTEIIAAIFNYNGSGRLGGERNFHKKGWSTVNNKERGRGGGVKITPARGHYHFAKLHSPTNGVPDRIIVTSRKNYKSCIGYQ